MPVVVTSNLPVIDISHDLDWGVKKMTPVTFPQIHFFILQNQSNEWRGVKGLCSVKRSSYQPLLSAWPMFALNALLLLVLSLLPVTLPYLVT